jgi:arylsulfotransferase ASST
VMYEWHSLDHVPLQSSYSSAKPGSRAEPFDYFHINSTDVERDGDLLVDSRETWAVYDVDPSTGEVRWQLGGKHSSFRLGPGAATAWQHDAREQPDGAITFFDNGAFPAVHPQSRAIELALDRHTMTASLVRRYEHKNRLVSGSQGNVQALANGDWMVGWGQAGYLSEVEPSGRVIFNAHLPPGWETYRTYTLPWQGQPLTPPSLVAERAPGADGRVTAFASWNGASAVASWRLLSGPAASELAPVLTTAKTDFETALALPASASRRYLAVQALDGSGAVLSVSAALRLPAAR